MWLRFLSDSDHWVITLQIADPSSRQRRHPTDIVQDCKFETATFRQEIISDRKSHKGTRYQVIPTDWLTVSRKVTLTSTVVSDERVMYGYESSATLTTDRLRYKLQTRPLVREGASRRRAKQFSSKRKEKEKSPKPRHADWHRQS
jgi:hypothetical protein